MSSFEIPKTAKRISSGDLENSFFRAWALRGSEGSNATERPHAASSSSPSPPPVSPRTQVPNRKTKSADQRKYISDSSTVLPSLPLRGPVAPYFEPSYSPPIILHEELFLPQTRASTSSASSDEISSARSSISTCTRKILGIPRIVAPKATQDKKPPFQARKGYKWKHETSGHWFEVRIGKKRATEILQANPEDVKPIVYTQPIGTPADFHDRIGISAINSTPPSLHGADSSRASGPQTSTDFTLKDSSADFLISLQDPREGLYCRTKRALGLKHGPVVGSRDEMDIPERSMTGEVGEGLNRVSSALRQFALRDREPTRFSVSTSNLSIAAPSAIARWQRLQPGSLSSTRSSSSSLRSLMRGHRPPPTPEPQSMYTGSDEHRYLSVELTDPDAPTFLPSEARRIHTPPLSTTTSGTMRARGYFSEHSVSGDAETPLSMSSNSTLPVSTRIDSGLGYSRRVTPTLPTNTSGPVDLPKMVSEPEWYKARIKAIEADEALNREQFVLSVPEHLPNSPMCPKHPKNKSKGKGVCVYHGRIVSSSSLKASAGALDAPNTVVRSEAQREVG